MADKPDKGTGLNLLLFFIIAGAIMMSWVQGGGPTRAKNEGLIKNNTVITSQKISTNNINNESDTVYSKYKGKIKLNSGTAKSTYQPNQEYIIISASGNEDPINIGGWLLKNGRDKKKYLIYGNTVQGQSATAIIPGVGYSLYHPFNSNLGHKTAITLKSGSKAYIITGNLPPVAGIKVFGNFKTNRCLGYLEDDSSYKFTPKLSYNCPSNDDTPGVGSLDNACYDFVRSIRSCHTPKDVYVKDEGYCLDRNCKLTTACRNFVQQNYTFQNCFNLYSGEKDFSAPEWRVFLNRTWELWEDRRETITLYDLEGKVVDEISY